MASEWFYTLNGQQVPAPASAAVLKQLAGSGQLKPTDLVWQEGMPNWMPASSIKGLFGGKMLSGELPAGEKSVTGSKSRPPKPTPEPGEPAGPPEMHPLLVLLLSTCTGGLFGLYYAYQVCNEYTARAPLRAADSAGRPLGRPRHPLAVLILSYLTLGLYFAYWLYLSLGECNAYLGRKDSEARTDLTLMLLFPPYAVYLAVVRLPAAVRAVQQQAKTADSTGAVPTTLFLNPCLYFAMPLLGMVQQDALNQVWLAAP